MPSFNAGRVARPRMTGTACVAVANRLFVDGAFPVAQPFAELTASTYRAPLEPLDFRHDAEGGRARINDWVADQTRDRIRDLLDKNVSPEIAAQLLRDGAALGGEERDVTILFSDLRGFTTMSEKLAPRDLLALLFPCQTDIHCMRSVPRQAVSDDSTM